MEQSCILRQSPGNAVLRNPGSGRLTVRSLTDKKPAARCEHDLCSHSICAQVHRYLYAWHYNRLHNLIYREFATWRSGTGSWRIAATFNDTRGGENSDFATRSDSALRGPYEVAAADRASAEKPRCHATRNVGKTSQRFPCTLGCNAHPQQSGSLYYRFVTCKHFALSTSLHSQTLL